MYISEPPEQFEVFKHLKILIGEWDVEVCSSRKDPTNKVSGQVTSQWLEPGPFVIQHAEFPNKEFPTSISLIGYDDASEEYSVLCSDSQNVSRVYRMQIDKDDWTVWGMTPDESQRFTGQFENEMNTIIGKWEKAADESTWEEIFKIILTRK